MGKQFLISEIFYRSKNPRNQGKINIVKTKDKKLIEIFVDWGMVLGTNFAYNNQGLCISEREKVNVQGI